MTLFELLAAKEFFTHINWELMERVLTIKEKQNEKN